MILIFPHKEILQLVLKDSVIPGEIAVSPVRFSFGNDSSLFVETDSDLPVAVRRRLNLLGVRRGSRHPTNEVHNAYCWFQIIPLEPHNDEERIRYLKGNIILEMNDLSLLKEIVQEILRLGNDRMALVHYTDQHSGDHIAFLHVSQPPYYTLIRALEPAITRGQQPLRAYYEQVPRLWVSLGWYYPLAQYLTIPDNRRLFIHTPFHWRFFDDTPFQNIYQSLDIQIPAEHVYWQPSRAISRIEVPLRLVPADPQQAIPSLWLIPQDKQFEFEEWLRHADQNLLKPLRFAVVEAPEQSQWILLYRNPHQTQQAVTLSLEFALPFAPHPLVGNLYVPRGSRLHPQLQRDVLQRLLVPEDSCLVWLHPLANQDFRPYIVTEDAFRTLDEWVNYVISQHRQSLQEWMDATTFSWPAFVTETEVAPPSHPPPSSDTEATSKKANRRNNRTNKKTNSGQDQFRSKTGQVGQVPDRGSSATPGDVGTSAASSSQELAQLEAQFQQLSGTRLDDPERTALWPQLAQAYFHHGQPDQAALCWLHALWHAPAEQQPSIIKQWYEMEWHSLTPPSIKSWKTLFAENMQTIAYVRRCAATILYWMTFYPKSCSPDLLQKIIDFMEKHQTTIPLRAIWIIYSNLSHRLGDPLLKSRTADRLLRLLLEDPATSLRDLPRFLYEGSLHYRQVRQSLGFCLEELLEHVLRWITAPPKGLKQQTPYIYYTFAYIAARLKMPIYNKWLEQAQASLTNILPFSKLEGNPIKQRFCNIVDSLYQYRIREAINGYCASMTLPNEIYKAIDEFEKMATGMASEGEIDAWKNYTNGQIALLRLAPYCLRRLLEKSRILEPVLQGDAISHYLALMIDNQNAQQFDADACSSNISGRIRQLYHCLNALIDTGISESGDRWEELYQNLQRLTDECLSVNQEQTRQQTINDYTYIVSQLSKFYQAAFRVAEFYVQSEWMRQLLNALDRQIQAMQHITEDGIPVYMPLLGDLVPTALYFKRHHHTTLLINYLNNKLQNWIKSVGSNLDAVDHKPTVVNAYVAAIIVDAVIKENMRQVAKLHQYMLRYIKGLQSNGMNFDKIKNIISYLKCVSYIGDNDSINYLRDYFRYCAANDIRLSVDMSTIQYCSLSYLQMVECLTYMLDSPVVRRTGHSTSIKELTSDWQVDNEYLLRRRIIDDVSQLQQTSV
ncbi:MAG: hypothetical protein NZU63_01610 [Gemmataceae bacterium]|nr:hypothetical protein [Gemmataceae bacterium]